MKESHEIVHPMPPVCDEHARYLILGSMPGEASLAAREYYAHPRNQFWEIMSRLFQFDRKLPYQERVAYLIRNGVALWDVIAACRRKGSLDAHIQMQSVRHHDIVELLHRYPEIKAIGFNGREAERQFHRSGQMDRSGWPSHIIVYLLPSTSPAMASMTLEQKLARWRPFFADTHE